MLKIHWLILPFWQTLQKEGEKKPQSTISTIPQILLGDLIWLLSLSSSSSPSESLSLRSFSLSSSCSEWLRCVSHSLCIENCVLSCLSATMSMSRLSANRPVERWRHGSWRWNNLKKKRLFPCSFFVNFCKVDSATLYLNLWNWSHII